MADGCTQSQLQADRPWLREVGKRDLNDIHHALRMIVKHPMVGADEIRLFENLANACWNEHARRCAEGEYDD